MDKETRNKIRREYKQSIQPMGVYQFKNTANNKILIGSSRNLGKAENGLRFQLEMGSYLANRELQKEWNEYVSDRFVFEILDELEPVEGKTPQEYAAEIKELEELWLEKLQPYGNKGYNKQVIKK
jgi:hypothetical protein